MNSGTIFEPYDRNFDPNGRYQGTANYNAILTNLVSQPTEGFDEDLFPYYCYCYDSLHNKLSHVGSLSHDGNTFTIHSVPVSSDGYLKHFVSCVTALGPDMLVGNAERCTPSAFRDRIQYYNPLNVDFSAYRLGFSFLVKNTDTGEQNWVFSIDDLKALDSTKNIVVQTTGRLFFKIESTGDWGGFVNNDNTSSIIYNCNDRVIYAKSSARFTGASGVDVVPHWTMGCLKNGSVVAANAEMNDADTGFLIAGVVNTVDGEIELPCSEQYNFTDDGLVIEVIEDWDGRDRITITTRLTIEQTLKEIAYLGLIVCHYSGATESVYAGYIDPDGLATGELIPYEDWEKTDSLNVKNQFMVDFPDLHIKPKPTPEPSDEDDVQSVGYGYFSNTTIGTLYALHNKLDLEDITKWLLTQTDKIDVAKNVVSLKEIPFPVADLGFGRRDDPVRMGGITITLEDGSTLKATTLVSPDIPTLNIVFADFDIPRLSNTFLDFSPYTQYELLLPFSPSPVNLPDWCVGKNVKGIFLYDIYTTGCQYVVECNGERICSVSGNFGVDRPLMAQNVAVRDATRLTAQLSTASSVIGGVVSGVTGNVVGIMNGAINGISSISQSILANKQNYMYTTGANGDSSSIALYHAAHLKITRTLSNADENFEHIYGRPLLKIRKLSDVSGYTVCDNINVSGINCTNEEKEMIKALLETGVYL